MGDAGPRTGTAGRCEVWVNCAVSADGRLAFARGARARLSGPEDLVRVQRLRTEVDAVLVGVGTVVSDNPSLRVHWDLLGRPAGKEPTRVVVDSSGRTPPTARVLDGSQATIVATTERAVRRFPPHVTVLRAGRERVDLRILFAQLPEHGVRRVLVEGGSAILASVAHAGLFDRWTVYYAARLIGGSSAPPMLSGPEVPDLASSVGLKLESVEPLGAGFLARFHPVGPQGDA